MYGDSVALGAQPALVRYAGSVDNRAQEAWHSWCCCPPCRGGPGGRVKADVVILHTGDNGLIPEDQLRAALDALKDIRCVILVTPKVPRSWEARAVATLRQVAPSYPNAVLADWHDYAQGRTAWFVSTGST